MSLKEIVDVDEKSVRDAEEAIRYIDRALKAKYNLQRSGLTSYMVFPIPIDAGELSATDGLFINPQIPGHFVFLERIKDQLTAMAYTPRRRGNIQGALERWSKSI